MKTGLFVKNYSTSAGNNELEEIASLEVYPNRLMKYLKLSYSSGKLAVLWSIIIPIEPQEL